jgi:hypothetical protein
MSAEHPRGVPGDASGWFSGQQPLSPSDMRRSPVTACWLV